MSNCSKWSEQNKILAKDKLYTILYPALFVRCFNKQPFRRLTELTKKIREIPKGQK